MGAVMGSKKLKGIVFSGSKKGQLADEEVLADYVREMTREFRDTLIFIRGSDIGKQR